MADPVVSSDRSHTL